jgi:signal peptidase I
VTGRLFAAAQWQTEQGFVDSSGLLAAAGCEQLQAASFDFPIPDSRFRTLVGRPLTLLLAILAGCIVAAAGAYVVFIAIDASVDGRPSRSYRNVTGAMIPTLLIGDLFTVVSLRGEKGALLPVSRGDLVAHRWPVDTSKLFVKRIVGVPGDTLAMVNGVLFVDGRKVDEPYGLACRAIFHILVGPFMPKQATSFARPGRSRRPRGDAALHQQPPRAAHGAGRPLRLHRRWPLRAAR